MRILIILHKEKKRGGLVLQFLKMSRIFKQEGHKLKIFSMDSVNKQKNFLGNIIINIKILKKIVKEFEPSIIITSDPFITTSMALLSNKKGIPIVSRAGAVYHSFYAARIFESISYEKIYSQLYRFLNQILKFIAKIFYKKIDFIIFNSQYLSDIYANSNSYVILNGVEISKLNTIQAYKPTRLIYVGRIEPRKSIELIIKALAILNLTSNNFMVSLVGDTSMNRVYWNKITNLIDKRNLSSQIKILGEIDNQKLPAILQEHDILLFSSDERNFPMTEGLPNVILEGMANGLAIIATKVAGVPEILKENNGFLVDSEPEIFAEKIKYLMDNKEVLIQMKKTNIETIRKNHNIENVSKKYLKIFEKIIKRKNS